MTIQSANMLRRQQIFAFLLFAPLLLAHALHPVDSKRLLTTSPWTVQVAATMDDPAEAREDSSEVPRTISQAGQPNVGNGNLDTNTRWDGQVGKNRMGHLATIPVLVRWDSAAVVRHALEERNEPFAAELNSAATGNFVLTVVGLLPARPLRGEATLQPKSSSEEAGSQIRSTEEVLEWFMGNSLLLIKGMPAVRPQNIKVDADTGTVHLFFTRDERILANKHEIDFVTRYGSMSVQARFRPKDMLVDGHPDL